MGHEAHQPGLVQAAEGLTNRGAAETPVVATSPQIRSIPEFSHPQPSRGHRSTQYRKPNSAKTAYGPRTTGLSQFGHNRMNMRSS
ncbi:hypothetical protein RCH22_002758 [Cryobacterium psychrotolerans]|nr:hypothetical protein [Cryobacterium psychrotolerans]